jgi:N-acetylglucosamine-6-phosphate deacetylase
MFGAEMLGIHLEGPFISKSFKGAQNEKYIVNPEIKLLKEFNEKSGNQIKVVTYAVEEASLEFTKNLKSMGIIPSVGHSGASFEQVMNHVSNGLSHITHFSNGQSPHHHRTPGVVSAGLYSDDLHTEIIVDGVHIHKDAVKMIHKVKGASNILLITDSMRAKRMPNGNYNLGGLDVVKTDTEVRTDYGSLAGSILSMDLAVRNMIKFTDCSLNEIAQMTSYNQAKSLGIESSRGSIEEGKIADLVVLNKNLEVIMTICKGKVVYDTYLD